MELAVADDATPPHLAAAGLELRLDEDERVPPVLEQSQRRGQDEANADERHVAHEQVGQKRQLSEVPRVRALEHGHPRIVPHLRVQLAVPDVDRDHPAGPVLEEGVGEPARRRSEVEAVSAVDLDLDLRERVRELLTAARHVSRRGLDPQLRILVDLMTRLLVPGHEPRQHERLRLRSALGEAALHEQDVQPLLHGAKRSPVPCYKCVMELRGDRVTLRPLANEDVPRLVELGADPEVARWWAGIDEPYLQDKVLDGLTFAIAADGEVAGMIQYYEEEDPEYRHAGMDLFLGTPFQDRGLGTDTVRTMARYLIEERGHHRLTIDPAAANERAIRCYEKVGFRRVGIMREYWLDPEGIWRDGVLLDLLARELR